MDLIDKKILYLLDNNSRIPFSQIAKKLNISKETCTYRIKKMVEENIITEFTTMISWGSQNLVPHKIYFQLHKLDKKTKEKVISELKQNKKINWIVESIGQYDLILSILCKNIREFTEEKDKLLEKYSEYILSYQIGIMYETYNYSRNYLWPTEKPIESYLIGSLSKIPLDKKDIQILKIISNNSRISSIELAQKTNLNVKTIISRIKKLEKNNIIVSYKIFLNLNKLNYKFYKAFIYLNKIDSKQYSDFIKFCKNNKNIVYLVKNVGAWEFEPEFELENEETFYSIINEMKYKFPDLIKQIDSIRIIKEHKIVYMPSENLN